MTVEIAILNKGAVALAADSAVTIGGGPKIYSSVNKLFALSKFRPVGVMFYNYADFLAVPWESIIKIYREQAGDRSFPTLREYFDDFLSFLRQDGDLFTTEQQQQYIQITIVTYLTSIRNKIDQEVRNVIDSYNRISKAEITAIAENLIALEHSRWRALKFVPDWTSFDLEDFIWQKEDAINELRDKVFGNLSLPPGSLNQMNEIAAMLFAKDTFAQVYTGLVVAGFGEKETFPSLCSCWVEGVIDHKLKVRSTQCEQIRHDNPVSLIPFAQNEMVGTFMEGIDPKLRVDLYDYVSDMFDKYPEIVVSKIAGLEDSTRAIILAELKKAGAEVSEKFAQKMGQVQRSRYIDPVIHAIRVLPKDELATMAESLVSLTSFKRRVSIDIETVGGPVDVAVISKGDGFVWVKRKAYFEPHLNLRHYSNYFNDVLAKWSNENDRQHGQ